MIGDGDTNIHFLSDLSSFYRNIQPILPKPIFARHLWLKNDLINSVDDALMPMIKQVTDAQK